MSRFVRDTPVFFISLVVPQTAAIFPIWLGQIRENTYIQVAFSKSKEIRAAVFATDHDHVTIDVVKIEQVKSFNTKYSGD